MFDMPVDTLEQKRSYRKFHKFLVNEGFIMHQYSIYSKILLNGTAKKTMVKRLEENNPKIGNISILTVTEKQFSKMIYLNGAINQSPSNTDSRIIFLGESSDDN